MGPIKKRKPKKDIANVKFSGVDAGIYGIDVTYGGDLNYNYLFRLND